MAALTDIFAAVSAYMDGLGLKPYSGDLSKFGGEHLSDVDSFPRIVWVPGSDSFAPASQRTETATMGRGVVARHTCKTSVEAHVWGKDYATTLDLRDAFIQALRSQLGPNYMPGSGRWEGMQNQAAGRKYVLSFTLDIPVTDAVPTTATITGTLQTDVAFTVPPPH